ncbi:hypothetical protein C0J52_21348 [Blattella germanica]|nr:hypothetical protein C0J52_21348 [Blattella germanica]
MLERDSMRFEDDFSGPEWETECQEKHSTETCDEKDFGGRTNLPVWQMVQDDEDDEENVLISKTVTRLSGKVRTCYLNHLESNLLKNYEMCNDKDRTEWPFSRTDLIKCAAWMEQKALRSCMVVILYQRAMARLTADIKKHTEQLKLYRKLKDFINFDSGWSTKTTQTDNNNELNLIDKETQTEAISDTNLNTETTMHSEILYMAPETLTPNINTNVLQTLDMKTDTPKSQEVEDTQGVPIPVYVSGMSSTTINKRNNHYNSIHVIKNIEPAPYTELNTINTNISEIPLPNGIEPLVINHEVQNVLPDSSCNIYPDQENTDDQVNENRNIPALQESNQDMKLGEPYVWSVVKCPTKINITNSNPSKQRVRVKRISSKDHNISSSNGVLHCEKQCDSSSENINRMTLDERISIVLGITPNSCNIIDEELIKPNNIIKEIKKEPTMWSIEKSHQQKLLHTKILETCVEVRKRGRMRLRFLELFGSDSEDSFDIDEEVSIHRDKIARWVVDSLMPYYRDGRILSRPLFKLLAKHISDDLLRKSHWSSK